MTVRYIMFSYYHLSNVIPTFTVSKRLYNKEFKQGWSTTPSISLTIL